MCSLVEEMLNSHNCNYFSRGFYILHPYKQDIINKLSLCPTIKFTAKLEYWSLCQTCQESDPANCKPSPASESFMVCLWTARTDFKVHHMTHVSREFPPWEIPACSVRFGCLLFPIRGNGDVIYIKKGRGIEQHGCRRQQHSVSSGSNQSNLMIPRSPCSAGWA